MAASPADARHGGPSGALRTLAQCRRTAQPRDPRANRNLQPCCRRVTTPSSRTPSAPSDARCHNCNRNGADPNYSIARPSEPVRAMRKQQLRRSQTLTKTFAARAEKRDARQLPLARPSSSWTREAPEPRSAGFPATPPKTAPSEAPIKPAKKPSLY